MATKLLLDAAAGAMGSGADGIVGKAVDLSPQDMPEDAIVLLHGSPAISEAWVGRPGVYWVVEQGLDATAELRKLFPAESFVPRVRACRAEVRYSMGERYQGEGFRVYVPDTGALRGYTVDDGDAPLTDWLHRAYSMGFETVWLSGSEIDAAGKGFDLEVLDRAKRSFAGNIVVSGGGVELRHLETLRDEGGCFAAIIPQSLVDQHGTEEVLLALRPPTADVTESEGEAA